MRKRRRRRRRAFFQLQTLHSTGRYEDFINTSSKEGGMGKA
jgi:hypothetical protein